MTTALAPYRDPAAPGRCARRRPARADDPCREDRPARVVLGIRGGRRGRPRRRSRSPLWPATASARSRAWPASTNLRAGERRGRATRSSAISSRKRGSGSRRSSTRSRLHGLLSRDAPCFQQSIGAAATWNPDLVEAMSTTIRRRMLATGARHALAPVLDITRDPRWGRIEETYGEDPYLAAALGCAYVRGLQGADLAEGVLATGKHMVGHGHGRGRPQPGAGPHRRARAARRAAVPVRGRGARGRTRPASCRPTATSTASRATPREELLTTILRDEWGFDGIVASDYIGVEMLATAAPADRRPRRRGAALALARRRRRRAAAHGRVRRAARASARRRAGRRGAHRRCGERVLRMKFRLGLFERPYVDPPSPAAARGARRRTRRALPPTWPPVARPARERRASCRSRRTSHASRSSVPSPTAPASCSATTATSSTWRRCSRCARVATPSASSADGDGIVPADELAGRPTILDALRARFAGARHPLCARLRHPGRDRRRDRGGGRRRASRPKSPSSSSASGRG